MGVFDLPSYWVYVEYENGERKNVANTDTLNETEAKEFKERWENTIPVVKVTLETSNGRIIKEFTY